MTKDELSDVANLSSGTIATITGMTTYEELEAFKNWMFQPLGNNLGRYQGEIVAFGFTVLEALENAHLVYINQKARRYSKG